MQPAAAAAAAACPCKGSRFLLNTWSAAQHGDEGRLRHLLRDHARDPDKLDEYGRAPLHFAAAGGHAGCVALLLRHGADANASACGALPLHRAAYGGHAGVVSQLLAAGSRRDDRDAATGDLRTPLAKAAACGHAAVCRLLLAAGADAATSDARGRAPWQLVPAAPGGGELELLRAALARGAGVPDAELGAFREGLGDS